MKYRYCREYCRIPTPSPVPKLMLTSVIAHARRMNGVYSNQVTELVIINGDVNFVNYRLWSTEKLFPNLPSRSVLGSYRNVQTFKPPSSKEFFKNCNEKLTNKYKNNVSPRHVENPAVRFN